MNAACLQGEAILKVIQAPLLLLGARISTIAF
jgi:hypothetical protein